MGSVSDGVCYGGRVIGGRRDDTRMYLCGREQPLQHTVDTCACVCGREGVVVLTCL